MTNSKKTRSLFAPVRRLRRRLCIESVRRDARRQVLGGNTQFNRIYHVHIRKTGGTAINSAFLGQNPLEQRQRFLELHERDIHFIHVNRFLIVGWDRHLINNGCFHYAFSHIPFPSVAVFPDTFCFTVIRDPVDRLWSYYKMLSDYLSTGVWNQTGLPHSDLQHESSYANGGFLKFLHTVPQQHLYNQLYMFSPSLNIDQGLLNASRLEAIYTSKDIRRCAHDFADNFAIDLKIFRHNVSKTSIPLSPDEHEFARQVLDLEYRFIYHLEKLENFVSPCLHTYHTGKSA